MNSAPFRCAYIWYSNGMLFAFDLTCTLLIHNFLIIQDLLKGWMFWRREAGIVTEQTVMTLTTVESNSSQIFPSRRPSVVVVAKDPPGLIPAPAPPYLRLTNASSFLHF